MPPAPASRSALARLLGNRRLLAGALLVLALLVLALWPDAVASDLAPVTRGGLTVTLDEEGETRVRRRFLVSAPVAGRLLRIDHEPGDRVVRGETVVAALLPIDPTPLDARSRAEAEAAVAAARAGVERARAEAERAAAAAGLAAAQLARYRELATAGVTSAGELDSREAEARASEEARRAAEFSLAAATHQLAAARARLLQASGNPGGGEIPVLAPIDGVVLRRLRESEAAVPAGEPLLELGDPADLEIVADYLSADAVRIPAGAPVGIEQWGGSAPLAGRVRRVEPHGFTKISALGVEEQRVNVVIDLEGSPEAWSELGDGYRVEVRSVVWEGSDLLLVPLSALFRQGGGWAVFVAEGGRARRRAVEIGHRDDLAAEVLSGLSAGDEVVVHPSESLADGARLRRREP